MNDKAVVSCPRCIRQYEVDAATDRVVAMCGVCKAHFVIVIPRLTGPAEDVLMLDKEIEPHMSFFKEACETMARNVCLGLRSSGEMVTPLSVMRFVDQVTGDEFIDRWNKRYGEGHEVALPDEDPDRFANNKLLAYFTVYIPQRSHFARDMLRSAFMGVLGGIEWPNPDDSREGSRP